LYEFGQSALAPYICSVPSMVQKVGTLKSKQNPKP
jgi:hypothetical protein